MECYYFYGFLGDGYILFQVDLETQEEYNMGYEATWPLSSVPASSTINSSQLLSVDPLSNPTFSRLNYSYPYAPVGESNAFSAKGGYYQVICQGRGVVVGIVCRG